MIYKLFPVVNPVASFHLDGTVETFCHFQLEFLYSTLMFIIKLQCFALLQYILNNFHKFAKEYLPSELSTLFPSVVHSFQISVEAMLECRTATDRDL